MLMVDDDDDDDLNECILRIYCCKRKRSNDE